MLGANALDVTTSLIPYWIDTEYQPQRSQLEWAVQLAMLGVAVLGLARATPALLRFLAALPIPRAPLLVCGAFVAVELAHIALRYERYPFSPVAMFSEARLEAPDEKELPALIIPRPEGAELFSFQREGDPSFARYFAGLDYKGSAALRMYRDAPRVHAILAAELASHGLPAPAHVYVRYRTSDGKVLGFSPRTPAESEQRQYGGAP